MRIAMIAPACEPVPPASYGGTERVVSWLTEELVRRGHAVTLYASGDSRTGAELVPVVDRALRLGYGDRPADASAIHMAVAHEVCARARDFDVIHAHVDYQAFPALMHCPAPALSTMHGRLDILGLERVCDAFPVRLVSISHAQRRPLPRARWIGTVHHGLDLAPYRVGPGRGDYALFLGRISPEKGPDTAIRVARRAGVRLVMAAKVDRADRAYHREVVEPLLRQGSGVEFIGEVDDREKLRLLADARALLFPIDWPEPFGLVMIEAMACGTPVVARRRGSVPEVVEHGRTGYVCDGDDELVRALHLADRIDRRACRAAVERRFSAPVMASAYEAIYESLADQHLHRAQPARHVHGHVAAPRS